MAQKDDQALVPERGDDFERWLKWQRDLRKGFSYTWGLLDELLEEYRLHADTRTPLNEHACDYQCGCEGKEEPRWRPGE